MQHVLLAAIAAAGLTALPAAAAEPYHCYAADLDGPLPKAAPDHVRVATFNAFLNRNTEDELLADLADPGDQLGAGGSDTQIRAVAEIIQRVRPEVLLLNEFDFVAGGEAVRLFQRNYLGVSQNGRQPIEYRHVFLAESNTGIPSGFDLDNSGDLGGPGDAFGFGFFPGQFGMALLSQHPIRQGKVRSFQKFLWQDMPDNLIPDGFYSPEELAVFRLSSKSHWDVPVRIRGTTVHLLAAHPTPPVFDGPEDRNGTRNHDEIRLWADYVGPEEDSRYIVDDRGRRGGLDEDAAFVILGDYNADPFDGDSTGNAILQFFDHPAIDFTLAPASFGGAEDSELEGGLNLLHAGSPALDTGDFNPAGPGNLRVDYVLPSKAGLDPVCGGVFWPSTGDETRRLVDDGFPVVSSDHHLVWLDLRLTDEDGEDRDRDDRGRREGRRND